MGTGRKAAIAAVWVTLCLLGGSATASAAADCGSATLSSQGANKVAQTVCEINAQRAAHGVAPLRWNAQLGTAAARMATDMVQRNFLSHVTPDGMTLATRLALVGFTRRQFLDSAGENLGWADDGLATPELMVAAWLTSPEHRQNMLDPGFNEMGIGVVDGSPVDGAEYGTVFVAEFGTVVRARPARRHRRRS